MRSVPGGWSAQDRDEFSSERICGLRSLPWKTIQQRDTRYSVQRSLYRRSVELHCRRRIEGAWCNTAGTCEATNASGRRPWIHRIGTACNDPVRWRSPADQTGEGIEQEGNRQDTLHSRRAHYRSPLRGCEEAARRALPVDRPWQHGDYYRASSGRHKNGRLDYRPGPRRRSQWWPDYGDRHTGTGRTVEKIVYGTGTRTGSRETKITGIDAGPLDHSG
jgi:hypothetical protein